MSMTTWMRQSGHSGNKLMAGRLEDLSALVVELRSCGGPMSEAAIRDKGTPHVGRHGLPGQMR